MQPPESANVAGPRCVLYCSGEEEKRALIACMSDQVDQSGDDCFFCSQA